MTALGRIWLADCDYYCSAPASATGHPLRDGITTEIAPFTAAELAADLARAHSCASNGLRRL